jgi:hypothetical protein
MRPSTILASVLAIAPAALAVSIEKSILVSYKPGTPHVNNLVDEARQIIVKAGGRITHDYKLIRFAWPEDNV